MTNKKKNTKGIKKTTNTFASSNNEVEKFIKITMAVVAFVLVFWLITYIITNASNKKTKTESVIQYNEILVGSILNRSQEEYYVLVEYEGDENLSSYQTLISTYNEKDEHLRVYTVDLSSGFNENYIDDDVNLKISDITDIRFNSTTLLMIKDGKITESITDSEEITDYLTELSA